MKKTMTAVRKALERAAVVKKRRKKLKKEIRRVFGNLRLAKTKASLRSPRSCGQQRKSKGFTTPIPTTTKQERVGKLIQRR